MPEKQAFVFLKGDDVYGEMNGKPARGKVVAFDAKSNKLTLQYRGATILHSSGRSLQGPIEQAIVDASDFELLYRKPVKENKK